VVGVVTARWATSCPNKQTNGVGGAGVLSPALLWHRMAHRAGEAGLRTAGREASRARLWGAAGSWSWGSAASLEDEASASSGDVHPVSPALTAFPNLLAEHCVLTASWLCPTWRSRAGTCREIPCSGEAGGSRSGSRSRVRELCEGPEWCSTGIPWPLLTWFPQRTQARGQLPRARLFLLPDPYHSLRGAAGDLLSPANQTKSSGKNWGAPPDPSNSNHFLCLTTQSFPFFSPR